jgi:hypothetical protein
VYQESRYWPPLGRKPKIGDLALPIKETLPALQVVKKISCGKAYFSEPGDTTREPAYGKEFVAFTEMPPVPDSD